MYSRMPTFILLKRAEEILKIAETSTVRQSWLDQALLIDAELTRREPPETFRILISEAGQPVGFEVK